MSQLWNDIVDRDAAALLSPSISLSWRDLRAAVEASPPHAAGQRVGIVGQSSIGVVLEILGALHHRSTPVLAHPRWPLAMREAAFARAGVGRPLSEAQRRLIVGDDATIVFTSGSSGAPRAVLHSASAHRNAAAGAAEVMPFVPGDRWLVSLPVCHVGGLALLFRALHAGGSLAFPAPGQSLVDAVVQLKPTHLSLVAPQLRDLLASPEARRQLARARVVLVGGGPTPSALFEAAVAVGVPVRQTWGLTETGGQVCTSATGQPGTCGDPLPGRRVRQADDGELLVAGAGLLSGFVSSDDVVPALGPDGTYATGDLGLRTHDGWSITGRKGFRFISGGENIQPEELATALGDAQVGVFIVPVPDERFGQRPFCFFDGALEDETIVRRLKSRADALLPRFMHPVAFARLPAMNGTKHRRDDLAALAARLHDGGAAASPSPAPAVSSAGVIDGL